MEESPEFSKHFEDAGTSSSGRRRRVVLIDVEDLLVRIRRHGLKNAETEQKDLRRLVKATRAASRRRRKVIGKWLAARAMLLETVRKVDASLAPAGLAMSMVDDVIHCDLAGAVEVRLHRVDGSLPRATFDIEVDLDGRQIGRMNGPGDFLMPALPPVESVTRQNYEAALMAFVHEAVTVIKPRKAGFCRHCAQPALLVVQFVRDEEQSWA